jgi:hypothetical protein
MMRALLAVSAATVALACSQACGSDLGVLVLLKASDLEDRPSALSLPGVDLSSRTVETAAVIDGTWGEFHGRARAEASGDVRSDWPGHAAIQLKELSWTHRVSDTWSVSVGQQQRTWGAALIGQPLGFFHAGPDLTDPFDSEGRIAGLPMIAITHLGDAVNLEAIASSPVGAVTEPSRLNGRQWAIKASGNPLHGLSAALILRQRSGSSPGAGATFSYAAGTIELHADAYYGAPEARLTYAGFIDLLPLLHTTSPFSLQRDGPAALRSVIGATWTPTVGLELRAEWSHRQDAAGKDSWDRYLAGIDLHRAGLVGPSAGLAFQNLAWDLGADRTRRDSVYVSATLRGDKASATAAVLTCPDDGGSVIIVNGGVTLAYRVNLSASASFYEGGPHSQFGLLPFSHSFALGLSRAF